jgi:hypothetical protein
MVQIIQSSQYFEFVQLTKSGMAQSAKLQTKCIIKKCNVKKPSKSNDLNNIGNTGNIYVQYIMDY